MKSLEIVNEMLNYPFEERILTELATNETIIREEELKQIKQDLEVLEIIRKKNVSLKDLKFSIQGLVQGGFETIEVVLWAYNLIKKEEEQLTIEELLKLKQWLEVNESGNE